MSRTIKAIEGHMTPRSTRAQRAQRAASSAELAGSSSPFDSLVSTASIAAFERALCCQARSATISSVRLGLQNGERKLVAEWQRGAEILGHAQRKLRLAFAPTLSPAVATLAPVIDRILPLSEERRAHAISQSGHTHGKIVLRVSNENETTEGKQS